MQHNFAYIKNNNTFTHDFVYVFKEFLMKYQNNILLQEIEIKSIENKYYNYILSKNIKNDLYKIKHIKELIFNKTYLLNILNINHLINNAYNYLINNNIINYNLFNIKNRYKYTYININQIIQHRLIHIRIHDIIKKENNIISLSNMHRLCDINHVNVIKQMLKTAINEQLFTLKNIMLSKKNIDKIININRYRKNYLYKNYYNRYIYSKNFDMLLNEYWNKSIYQKNISSKYLYHSIKGNIILNNNNKLLFKDIVKHNIIKLNSKYLLFKNINNRYIYYDICIKYLIKTYLNRQVLDLNFIINIKNYYSKCNIYYNGLKNIFKSNNYIIKNSFNKKLNKYDKSQIMKIVTIIRRYNKIKNELLKNINMKLLHKYFIYNIKKYSNTKYLYNNIHSIFNLLNGDSKKYLKKYYRDYIWKNNISHYKLSCGLLQVKIYNNKLFMRKISKKIYKYELSKSYQLYKYINKNILLNESKNKYLLKNYNYNWSYHNNKYKLLQKYILKEILKSNAKTKMLDLKLEWFILEPNELTDKIIIPNIDYSYETTPIKDINKHPISSINSIDYKDVNIGNKEIEVSIKIMQQMLNFLFMIWHGTIVDLKAQTPIQSIETVMQGIYLWLMKDDVIQLMNDKESRKDYLRIYRWFRWEAEKVWIIEKNDSDNNGIKSVGMMVANIIDYMKIHHYNIVPITNKEKIIAFSDISRAFTIKIPDYFRDNLDKKKGKRKYYISTKNINNKIKYRFYKNI